MYYNLNIYVAVCYNVIIFVSMQMYNTLKGDAAVTTWDVSESALFVMAAIARDISPWVQIYMYLELFKLII